VYPVCDAPLRAEFELHEGPKYRCYRLSLNAWTAATRLVDIEDSGRAIGPVLPRVGGA